MASVRKNSSKNRKQVAKINRHRQLLQGVETLEHRRMLAPVWGGPGGSGNGKNTIASSPVWQPSPTPTPNPTTAPPYPLNQTFLLHSYPQSSKKIFLDFDGYVTTGTAWNQLPTSNPPNIDPINTPAFDFDGNPNVFSDPELERIQRIWQGVMEDFAPFAVDVTTEDPGVQGLLRTDANDQSYGMVAAIGGQYQDWFNQPAGGVAYVDVFDDIGPTYKPAFVFSTTQGNDEHVVTETISHEVGHTLGLSHDGDGTAAGYYGGHGTGPTSWGPIMGASFNVNVTQWSKGEYPTADNQEDDLRIITSQNGIGYRVDDFADTPNVAVFVTPGPTGTATINGIIEQTNDRDWFKIKLPNGAYSITASAFETSPNLDIELTLLDANFALVSQDNPVDSLNASLSGTATAGTYYIRIDGVGKAATPSDPGYSDYGSLGQYTLVTTAAAFASISGVVYKDLNSSGTKDASDLPFPNLQVYNDANNNGSLDSNETTVFTLADGSYKMGGSPGTANIRILPPAGYKYTNPVSGVQQVVIPDVGGDITGVNFGLVGLPGMIIGHKFLDLNSNGVVDANLGEKGIEGVVIYIDSNNDGRLSIGERAAVTDRYGGYVIPGVPEGTHHVKEVMAPGYFPVSPGPAGNTVTITPGLAVSFVDFYNNPAYDFGDAPNSYSTLAASGGPYHAYLAGYGLGTRVDRDPNGRPSTLAFGDDFNASDDEDGVTFLNSVSPGGTLSVQVSVMVPAGRQKGYLHGWIDWNQNGKFDTNEKVIRAANVGAGSYRYNFAVPSTVVPGQLFARFRYGPESTLGVGGPSGAGEVEDYSAPVYLNVPFPRADNVTVDQFSTNNRLDVLANDVRSTVNQLNLVNTGYPLTTDNGGTVSYNNNGTPANVYDDYLTYSAPPRGLPGTTDPLTDHFTYRVTDGTTQSNPVDVNITLRPVSTAPVAADDTLHVSGTAASSIFVLANDRPGTNLGVLNTKIDLFSIDTSTVPANVGTVAINNNGTATDRSDDYLVFTPAAGLATTPTIQFTYTVVNPGATTAALSSTATVTLDVGGPEVDTNDAARLSFRVFSVAQGGGVGTRIDNAGSGTVYSLTQGTQYWVGVFAFDTRAAFNLPASSVPGNGVISPYLDISYTGKYISTVRDATNVTGLKTIFDPRFSSLNANQSGRLLSEGFIDEIGATTISSSFGADAKKDNPVFYIRFTANAVTPGAGGVALFQADPADTPDHDVVVTRNGSPSVDPAQYGNQVLNVDEIAFLRSNLFRVVAAPGNILVTSTPPKTTTTTTTTSTTVVPTTNPTTTTTTTNNSVVTTTKPTTTTNNQLSAESLDAALLSLLSSTKKK